MILKAITYNYTWDGVPYNKVVGIFAKNQLHDAINDIRNGFGVGKEVKTDKFDNTCDNYFLEYADKENSYFYSSDYTVGELKL